MMNTQNISKNKMRGLMSVCLCLAAIPILVGVNGCTTGRYSQSEYEQRDDDATSHRVQRAISDDPQARDFEEINVETFKRVVQLSGFVDTQEIKSRAGDLAGQEAGTRDVRNNITVKE